MNIKKSLILLVFATIIASSAWAGTEQVIPLEQVSSEHRKIAQDLFPNAKFSSADIETDEDGTRVYEIKGQMPDGRKVEVDLFEAGSIEEYEIEFSETEVPGAVVKAINKKVPGFTPTYIEASHSDSGKVTKYEMEGVVGGQSLDIEVSADGRKIEIADQ